MHRPEKQEVSCFDSISTEKLQKILRKHASGELETEPDTQDVLQIMAVLSKRQQQQDPQGFSSSEKAFTEFCKYYI